MKKQFLEREMDLSDPSHTFYAMIRQFDLLEKTSNLKKFSCNPVHLCQLGGWKEGKGCKIERDPHSSKKTK